MVAPSRPPRTKIASAAATYAAIGPANARDTRPTPRSAAYRTTARNASSAADSNVHGSAFQMTTWVQRPPYPNGTSPIAATASASQPRPSPAATIFPPDHARQAMRPAIATVAMTLSTRPVTNGSPTDASRKYSGG